MKTAENLKKSNDMIVMGSYLNRVKIATGKKIEIQRGPLIDGMKETNTKIIKKYMYKKGQIE